MTELDDADRMIVEALSLDARQSLAALGARAGLSASAVNERLRRLLARGTIRALSVDADPAAMGCPVTGFVFVELATGGNEAAFRDIMRESPEVTACHHVTGPWSYLVQIRVADLDAVETFLAGLKAGGQIARSETLLALSAVVDPPFRPRGV
ncbi:Lrp/AsnC family transcriptional regulator [Phaeovulum vinaykumarii]|uniref:Lrp/AsnC family transcriptional regulator, leucine-responsive regulatory protein n=1 Tax=Phaeovulum vinaykumarii TaxID=407234 RepID=A0A1N7LHC5_9RHOB|nr:Lrp/AsnC family transcriptional regulator [Phaeovulum vinaykumarii]SIS73193.1 Lrp/AsnC family transcriptional regulator, leucine-responsive regulatory protein [Phaeovulum vinaykumarii]SOC04641.1 Lrp/AsnC family leucine-responsive transcriptional regulator [Phaeovulum vinaykumarii]